MEIPTGSESDTGRRLPVGKLPASLLAKMLATAPIQDPRVLLGPGIGLDCAVVEAGPDLLVFKTDPITFATQDIGWYAVQVCANDIATTGAVPRWLLAALLLPEGNTSAQLAGQISDQIFAACRALGIAVIGGHTEITYSLDRPIVVCTLIGEVSRTKLVTPRGAQPGDRVLLTKGIPIEATSILARQFPERLRQALSEGELEQARDFLVRPGISVLPDAQAAMRAGKVTAMHDPTEGGLSNALWELSEACGCSLLVDLAAAPIPPLSARICQALRLDPYSAIASGALLLTAAEVEAQKISQTLYQEGIPCTVIGEVRAGSAGVWQASAGGASLLPRPERDSIAELFES